MFNRLSSRIILNSIKRGSRPIIANQKRFFPCIVESSDERASRLVYEKIEVLNANKMLEEKLCDARSILANLSHKYPELKNTGIGSRLKQHMVEHKDHRLQEHNLRLFKTKTNLDEIRSELEQSTSVKSQQDVRSEKLNEKIRVLESELKKLEGVNTESQAFMDRESSEDVGRSYKRS